MMPPFVVFPTNRIAHFVEVSLYLFYLAQQVKLQIKTKGRWELSGVRYITSPKTSNSMGTWIPDGGTFKVTQKNCSLTAYVFDPKTKQSEECLIIFK